MSKATINRPDKERFARLKNFSMFPHQRSEAIVKEQYTRYHVTSFSDLLRMCLQGKYQLHML